MQVWVLMGKLLACLLSFVDKPAKMETSATKQEGTEMIVWTPETGSTYGHDQNPVVFAVQSYHMWIKKIVRDIRYPEGPPQ